MSSGLVKHSASALKHYMTGMNISVQELALKTKISESKIIRALNSDEKILKLSQLQKIGEKLFVPTVYLSTSKYFYNRERPDYVEFRNNNDFEFNAYRDKALIEEICSVREDYLSILESLEESPDGFFLKLKGDNPIEDAKKIIDYFSFHTSKKKIQNQDDYFKSWRLLVEEKSILVIEKPKFSYGSDGLCLFFSEVPIITIFSSGQNPSRKLFTLIHEIVHLGLGQSVFDGKLMQENQRSIERYCDQVAGHVVAPINIISSKYDPKLTLENNIARIRSVVKASKASIAIQLKNIGYISQENLNDYLFSLESKKVDFKGGPKKESLVLNYFGYNFVEKVFSAMWREAIPAATAKQILRFNDSNSSESFNKLQSKVY